MLFPSPEMRSPTAYGDFTDDGLAAIQASPGYFEFWDKWKTLALVSISLLFAVSVLRR